MNNDNNSCILYSHKQSHDETISPGEQSVYGGSEYDVHATIYYQSCVGCGSNAQMQNYQIIHRL